MSEQNPLSEIPLTPAQESAIRQYRSLGRQLRERLSTPPQSDAVKKVIERTEEIDAVDLSDIPSSRNRLARRIGKYTAGFVTLGFSIYAAAHTAPQIFYRATHLFGVADGTPNPTLLTLNQASENKILTDLRTPGAHQEKLKGPDGVERVYTFWSWGGYTSGALNDINGKAQGLGPEGVNAILLPTIMGKDSLDNTIQYTYIVDDGKIYIVDPQTHDRVGWFNPNYYQSASKSVRTDGKRHTGAFVFLNSTTEEDVLKYYYPNGNSPSPLSDQYGSPTKLPSRAFPMVPGSRDILWTDGTSLIPDDGSLTFAQDAETDNLVQIATANSVPIGVI